VVIHPGLSTGRRRRFSTGIVNQITASRTHSKRDLQEQKSSTYSRQTITTYDEKGEPHTENYRKMEGDADVEPFVIAPDIDVDLPIPPILPSPSWQKLEALNFNLSALVRFLLLDYGKGGPTAGMGEEFTEKFREQFSDFL